MMRTRSLYTRTVTLVTLLALFALGGSSAFGARTCMHSDAAATEQPQPHDHGAPDESGGGPIPCQHDSAGGMCAPAPLPATTATFAMASPIGYSARFVEVALPDSLDTAAVFHPPRS